jgi:hypothetical protein
MPNSISIPFETQQFIRLVDFLRAKKSVADPVEIIANAVDYWIDNAAWKEDDLIPQRVTQYRGFQWKSLLLPPGTQVRMKYKGAVHHASIEGDDLIYKNKKTTPSEFANSIAENTARNAWRDLWIKRPSDRDFRLADEIRKSDDRS